MFGLDVRELEKLEYAIGRKREEVLLVFMIFNTIYMLENLKCILPTQTSPWRSRLNGLSTLKPVYLDD